MTTSRCAFESPFKTMTAYVAGHCRSDHQTCPPVRVYTQYNTASIRLSTDVTEVIAANAIFLRIQADSRLSRCGTYTKYLMYKSGQQRLAAEQRNFLFFAVLLTGCGSECLWAFLQFFSRFPLQMGKNVVYCLLSHLCEKYELRGEAHGRGQAHSGQAQEPPHFRYCPGRGAGTESLSPRRPGSFTASGQGIRCWCWAAAKAGWCCPSPRCWTGWRSRS